MTCLLDTDLAALEAGTLEAARDAEAREHVRSCERCDARREDLVGTVRLLGAIDAAEIAPPAACWTAVEARIEGREPPSASIAIACAYCKGKLGRTQAVYCAGCIAPHHEDCWEEHGRCAACSAREFVKAAVSVRPRPRRRRSGWLIAAAGVLAGGGAVAALQGRGAAPPVATVPLPPAAPDVPPASEPSSPTLAELRARFDKYESLNSDELIRLVKAETAALASRSPAADVDRVARASLLLAGWGYHDQARPACERVLQLEPRNVPAHQARARVAMGQGQTNVALEEFATIAQLAPGDMSIVIEQARFLRTSGAIDKARALVERVIASGADADSVAEAYRVRSWIRDDLHDAVGALADLRAAVERSSDEEIGAEFVRALLSRSDIATARAFLDARLADDPDRGTLRALRANVKERVLDYEGALVDLEKCMERRASSAEDLHRKARLLLLLCDPGELADEAQTRAGRPLTLGDLTADVAGLRAARMRDVANIRKSLAGTERFNGALVDLALGDRERVIQSWFGDGPTEDAPDFAAEAALRGYLELLGAGRAGAERSIASGREWFEAALGAKRDLPLALAGLATTYHRGGDADRAGSLFAKARAAAVASPDAEEARAMALGFEHARLARLTRADGERRLAHRAFTRAIRRDPLNAVALVERAKLARDFGRWDAAVDDINAAGAVDPSCSEAWRLLAVLDARDLPEERDSTTLLPVRTRHFGGALTAVDKLLRLPDSDFIEREILGGSLQSGAVFVEQARSRLDEVAPVLSGAPARLDKIERALIAGRSAVHGAESAPTADAKGLGTIPSSLAAWRARAAALVAEARALESIAHDPWTALDCLLLAETIDRGLRWRSRERAIDDAEVAAIRASCRQSLGLR